MILRDELVLIGTSCSLISTSLVIFVYLTRPYLRTYGFFLVLMLCLMDFFFCLFRFGSTIFYYERHIDVNDLKLWCRIQGTVVIYSILSSYFWAATISFILYQTIILKDFENKPKKLLLSVINQGLPLIICMVQVKSNKSKDKKLLSIQFIECTYGLTGQGLSTMMTKYTVLFMVLIENKNQKFFQDQFIWNGILGIILTIFCYELWFWMAFLWDCYVVITVYKYFQKNQEQTQFEEKTYQYLYYYPVVMIASWFLNAIYRIFSEMFGVEITFLKPYWLFLSTLDGLFNTIVYGYCSLGIDGIKDILLCKHCWFSQTQQSESISDLYLETKEGYQKHFSLQKRNQSNTSSFNNLNVAQSLNNSVTVSDSDK